VTRFAARPVALCLAALLIGTAAAGCGHRGGSTDTPIASSPATASASAPANEPSDAAATQEPADTPTPAGPATPDPVASELDQINSLINDISNSISNSDSSQQGGE
jgi:hypothetical protein